MRINEKYQQIKMWKIDFDSCSKNCFGETKINFYECLKYILVRPHFTWGIYIF